MVLGKFPNFPREVRLCLIMIRRFRPVEQTALSSNPEITYLNGYSTPLAIFRFKYRS
jgi:hypothetical protein